MKLFEVLERLDRLVPNEFSRAEKIRWLDTLEGHIYREIIQNHEGAEEISYSGYDEDTPETAELIVPNDYAEVYDRYLESMVHYHNGEIDWYNNAAESYNAAYTAFQDMWNRTHMPIQKARGIRLF